MPSIQPASLLVLETYSILKHLMIVEVAQRSNPAGWEKETGLVLIIISGSWSCVYQSRQSPPVVFPSSVAAWARTKASHTGNSFKIVSHFSAIFSEDIRLIFLLLLPAIINDLTCLKNGNTPGGQSIRQAIKLRHREHTSKNMELQPWPADVGFEKKQSEIEQFISVVLQMCFTLLKDWCIVQHESLHVSPGHWGELF